MIYLTVADLAGHQPLHIWLDLTQLAETVADDSTYQALTTDTARLHYLIDNYDTNVEAEERKAIALVKRHLSVVYDLSATLPTDGSAAVQNDDITQMLLPLVIYGVARAGGLEEVPPLIRRDYDQALKDVKAAGERRLNLTLDYIVDEDGNDAPANTFMGGNYLDDTPYIL